MPLQVTGAGSEAEDQANGEKEVWPFRRGGIGVEEEGDDALSTVIDGLFPPTAVATHGLADAAEAII